MWGAARELRLAVSAPYFEYIMLKDITYFCRLKQNPAIRWVQTRARLNGFSGPRSFFPFPVNRWQ